MSIAEGSEPRLKPRSGEEASEDSILLISTLRFWISALIEYRPKDLHLIRLYFVQEIE